MNVDAMRMYQMPDGVQTRWASPENPTGEPGAGGKANAGRKGRPCFAMNAGESVVLAEASGVSGVVRRIWMTLTDRSARMLRGLRLDFYWDGAKNPAVSTPLGDFFGMGLGRTAPFESALFSSPQGRSFNCVVPMPFRRGMKIVVTNESGVHLDALFYDVAYTIGDKHDGDVLYFHAYFRRENPTTAQRDYEILPRVQGRGRYLGANIGVIADQTHYRKLWWGEGEVKIYLDGDREFPTLCGTGTEDYVGSGFGLGPFAQQQQGCTVADSQSMRFCFYRYHVKDPVYFEQDARATIQQLGWIGKDEESLRVRNIGTVHRAGPGLVEMSADEQGVFERTDDWSSCAYFYLDRADNGLPQLIGVDKRSAGL
jgi:D-arabinan exo alpha-(1,3)/(1,5)-arabinofuranosidase (non-reducing end)